MVRPRMLVALAVLVPALAMLAAACSDSADSKNSAAQANVDRIDARVQRNEMMSAIITLDGLPLHEMDVSLAASTVESAFVPDTRTAIRMLKLTNWVDELKDDADKLHGEAVNLLKALEADNVDAAKAPAHNLHEGAHEFHRAVWAVLARDLPSDAGGPEPTEAAGADETPAAGTTPAAGSTPRSSTPVAGTTAAGGTRTSVTPAANGTP